MSGNFEPGNIDAKTKLISLIHVWRELKRMRFRREPEYSNYSKELKSHIL